MSVTSLGICLDETDSVHLSSSRVDEEACLTIKTEGTDCEIRMDRAVVERLRDQIPPILVGMDRWVIETEACVKAGTAEKRAIDAAARALDLAAAAEQVGDHNLAASLRRASAAATDQANVVDAAVTAFEEAAVDADRAADRLIDLIGTAEVTLRHPREVEHLPAETVGSAAL